MYRIYNATADTYITNRVISGDVSASLRSNVGGAGTLDLYKLYGVTFSGSVPNLELSRGLLKFDTSGLSTLVSDGTVDITSPYFKAFLKLSDVYGGQPCPLGFTLAVYPMSRSWDEGVGRDIVYYGDIDSANYLTASGVTGVWTLPGAGSGGAIGSSTADYITSFSGGSLPYTQTFTTGFEDLYLDVTSAISASVAGVIPDNGFRISYSSVEESDTSTYFVKRFATRNAYDRTKRPQLIVLYDDSVEDDSSNLHFDATSSLFFYSFVNGVPTNVISGSTTISGDNSLLLRLVTDYSGSTSTGTGSYTLTFTGSQHRSGINAVPGVYSASVYLNSGDPFIATKIALSGSVNFTPYWTSLDGTVCYLTASRITATPPDRRTVATQGAQVTLTCNGVENNYQLGDTMFVRVDIFDPASPYIKLVKTPIIVPSSVKRNVHYSIVDVDTGTPRIPFDTTYNSTRCSSDSSGNYFKFDTTSLVPNKTYRIDIMINAGSNTRYYRDVSNHFRVTESG